MQVKRMSHVTKTLWGLRMSEFEAAKGSSAPWEKEPQALTQFDWLTSVGLSVHHGNTPTDLKLAATLMRFCSGQTMMAWPTVDTLAEYAGCHRTKAQNGITRLKNSGALVVVRIADLPDNLREKVKRRGRGNAYALNMSWAAEILSVKPFLKKPEPSQLKKSRQMSQGNVAGACTLPQKPNVATQATSIVATQATLQCSYCSYTNIDTEIEGYRDRAGNMDNRAAALLLIA